MFYGIPPASSRAQKVDSGVLQALRAMATDGVLTLHVSGGCMSPLLPQQARVEVRAAQHYWPGDVLVFRSRQGRLFMHRLVGIYRRRGRWCFLAQPDRASRPDSAVDGAEVIGRVCGGDGSQLLSEVPWRHRALAIGRFVNFAAMRLGSRLHGIWRTLPRISRAFSATT